MQKGNAPKFRNGRCSTCGVRERRRAQRTCLECHAEQGRRERALAEFARIASLAYGELKAEDPDIAFTLEDFRSAPVVIAFEKVWLAGRV